VATIGIDGSRLSVGERTGTETYCYHLLTALARLGIDDDIRVYLNAAVPPSDLPPIGTPICIPFPRLWTHLRLSLEMQLRPPAVLFVPSHVVPLRHPRSVVTIHDVGYLHHPDTHPANTRRLLDLTTRWSTQVARQVIAISEATKRDLIAHYRVPESRIRVVPHGVAQSLRCPDPQVIAELKRRLDLPPSYVLFVGTVQPRKNLGRLAAALSFVAKAGLPHHLVIAGKRGWLAEGVETELLASGMSNRIHLLGYVPATDLSALYGGADAVCFPSLYEGFGLPVLEAMAHGTPVVTSNTAALPEVAGDAALLVDPFSPAAIGDALCRVLTDGLLRASLIERGYARARSMTWERTARETLAVLRDVRDTSTDSTNPNRQRRRK